MRILPIISGLLLASQALATSDRSTLLLDYECHRSNSETRLTLFGNGTLRLKETPPGLAERMFLHDLLAEQLEGFRNRLEAVDLREIESLALHLRRDGELTETCSIELNRREGQVRFSYQVQDALPLGIDNVLFVVRDLLDVMDESGRSNVPKEYEPEVGDILERKDGNHFRVVGLSTLMEGIELQGVDQPMVLYLQRKELRGEFVRVVE